MTDDEEELGTSEHEVEQIVVFATRTPRTCFPQPNTIIPDDEGLSSALSRDSGEFALDFFRMSGDLT